jgi:hypothetical protein
MPGKRLVIGGVLLALLGTTGCCNWCRKHCGTEVTAYPAGACVPVCCAPAAQPQTCAPAVTYQQTPPPPQPYQGAPQSWQRSYAAPAQCICP